MAVPPELRQEVLFHLDYPALLTYFESTHDPLQDDPLFWQAKALVDFDVSSHDFHHPNAIEAEIPVEGHQRYIQILSRDETIKGSEQFLTLAECCYDSVKRSDDVLIDYFVSLITDSEGDRIRLTTLSGLLYGALETQNTKWVNYVLSHIDLNLLDSETVSRAMGRSGNVAQLKGSPIRTQVHGMLVGMGEAGIGLHQTQHRSFINDDEGEIFVATVIGRTQPVDNLNEIEMGRVLPRIGTLVDIQRAVDDGLIDEYGFTDLMSYALRFNDRPLYDYLMSLNRRWNETVYVLLSSKPSSLLAEFLDTTIPRQISSAPEHVLDQGFINRATYLYVLTNVGIRGMTIADPHNPDTVMSLTNITHPGGVPRPGTRTIDQFIN